MQNPYYQISEIFTDISAYSSLQMPSYSRSLVFFIITICWYVSFDRKCEQINMAINVDRKKTIEVVILKMYLACVA